MVPKGYQEPTIHSSARPNTCLGCLVKPCGLILMDIHFSPSSRNRPTRCEGSHRSVSAFPQDSKHGPCGTNEKTARCLNSRRRSACALAAGKGGFAPPAQVRQPSAAPVPNRLAEGVCGAC